MPYSKVNTMRDFSSIPVLMEDWENRLRAYHAEGKWRDIIKMADAENGAVQRHLLWAWPSEGDLDFILNATTAHGCSNLLSIGCGSGLLEWMIQASTCLSVVGIEIDVDWWNSKHSPSAFIPLQYVETPLREHSIKNIFKYCKTKNDSPFKNSSKITTCFEDDSFTGSKDDFGLLFCYFNNGEVFRQYLDVFQGTFLIIIGPVPGLGVYSDPMPIGVAFQSKSSWNLCMTKVTDNNKNIIAVYCKYIHN